MKADEKRAIARIENAISLAINDWRMAGGKIEFADERQRLGFQQRAAEAVAHEHEAMCVLIDCRTAGEGGVTDGRRLMALLGYLELPLRNALEASGPGLATAGEPRGNVDVYWRTAREYVEELLTLRRERERAGEGT